MMSLLSHTSRRLAVSRHSPRLGSLFTSSPVLKSDPFADLRPYLPTAVKASQDPKDYDRIVRDRRKYMTPFSPVYEAFDVPCVLTRGEMQYMWDIQGRKYLDLLGQNLTISVGHRHPKVVAAFMEQMLTLPHCTTMYYHEQPAALAKALVEKMPPHPSGADWVVQFTCSGSEAVDLAIQMARVYTNRNTTLGCHKAYHGLQGYACALTAIHRSNQSMYSSMFTGVHHVMPNSFEQLEEFFAYKAGEKMACCIIEPLQGYGGVFPLSHGYLQTMFKGTRERGGVCIADEVQTGMGRTGDSFWGFGTPNNDAIPDMVTFGKGIGNGVGVVGGVICIRPIAEAFTTKFWFNTYASSPSSCAAARAVLKVIDEEGLQENARQQGLRLTEGITELCKLYPQALKEIRGSGLFLGLEIAGKTAEDSQKNSVDLHVRLLKHGVVVGRGSAAGNVFRLQPPMCFKKEDVDHVINSIEDVTKEFIKEKGL